MFLTSQYKLFQHLYGNCPEHYSLSTYSESWPHRVRASDTKKIYNHFIYMHWIQKYIFIKIILHFNGKRTFTSMQFFFINEIFISGIKSKWILLNNALKEQEFSFVGENFDELCFLKEVFVCLLLVYCEN